MIVPVVLLLIVVAVSIAMFRELAGKSTDRPPVPRGTELIALGSLATAGGIAWWILGNNVTPAPILIAAGAFLILLGVILFATRPGQTAPDC